MSPFFSFLLIFYDFFLILLFKFKNHRAVFSSLKLDVLEIHVFHNEVL